MSRHVVIEYNNMPRIADEMRAGASRVVRETAFGVEADIKARMAMPKTGRRYIKSIQVRERARSLVVTTLWHQASAPGEAPAVDEGTYINSIKTNAQRGSLTAIVSTNMEKGPHLEFGTVRMAARPHFTPAMEHAGPIFQSRMRLMLGLLR